MMHLERFQLENLGPIVAADLDLDPHFNVLAGINGAGKSTILSAIALMLGRYSSAVRTGKAVGTFDRERIRHGARTAQASATGLINRASDAATITWSAGVSRPGRRVLRITQSSALVEYATSIAEEVELQPGRAKLPISVFYSVNRAVLDIPLRIRSKVNEGPFAALEDALNQSGRSFRNFFAWFREREDYENELRAEGTRRRDPQLGAVRNAVANMLPGFSNLRVKRQPVRMLISKEDIDLRVDELSDGEKCVLAMVGDLARRLAIANPGLRNPLEGSAIVLIDELELHLHPAWQRQTVTGLRATFPNCQFIVTTHSAQVLSEVQPESIFLLSAGEIARPRRSAGRDSNLILEELMGTTARPVWANAALDYLYEAIDDEEFDAAREQLLLLEAQLGIGDPSLVAARTLLSQSSTDR